MEKIINIDGRDVGFKATALTPRLYRHHIGRDIVRDMKQLDKAFKKAESGAETEEEKKEAQLSVIDLEIFENVAYIMARQYDPGIPDTPEEWLEEFSVFSIYEVLPEILKLWNLNNRTTAVPKKNRRRRSGNRRGQHSS